MVLFAKFRRYWPWAAYSIVALSVLWPLLGRGFVLTLDMVFTPKIRMPTSVTSSYLLRVLLHWLNYALPGDVIEKIVLFVILLLSGVGMHLLAERLVFSGQRIEKVATLNAIPALFAGILYTINPFTYDRFMAGQYNVLLGCAFLPWFVRALLLFVAQPGWRRTLVLAAWAVAVSIVFIHAVGFMALVVLVVVGSELWRRRADKEWMGEVLKFGLLSAGVFVIASSYWLVPLALGHGNTAATIDSFGSSDQTAFATLGGSAIGRLGNVLQLQGFWAESTDLFNSPQDSQPFWLMIVWALALVGGFRWWRQRKRTNVVAFALIGLVSAVLAAGIGTPWLAAHVPLFAGYREPQKFDALVALTLVLFAASGISTVLEFACRHARRGVMVVASLLLLVLPFAWTPTMIRAFDQQLGLAQYPAGWYDMNARLDASPGNFQTLFLPWHLYMYFSFEGRIIANPAPQFFDRPMIISNNAQFAGIPPSPNGRATAISTILASADKRQDLAARLAPYHVRYVLLALDDDYTKYNYLRKQTGLQLVAKNGTLELYKVTQQGVVRAASSR